MLHRLRRAYALRAWGRPVVAGPPAASRVASVAFTPHASFWQQLLLHHGDDNVFRVIDPFDRALRHASVVGQTTTCETWRDVTLRAGALDVHFGHTPVRLEFTHKGDALLSVAQARSNTAGVAASPSSARWRTYGDLIPFPLFVEDLRAYFTKKGLLKPEQTSYKPGNTAFQLLKSALPCPIMADMNIAFNEVYHLMATLAFVENIDETFLNHTGPTGTLFGVAMPLCCDASVRVGATEVTKHFRQVDLVRHWLLKTLLPDGTRREEPAALHVNLSHADGAGAAADAWRKFVHDVMASGAGAGSGSEDAAAPVKVFLAKIADVDVATTAPNPAHKEWEQKLKAVRETPALASATQEALLRSVIEAMPPKELVSHAASRVVRVDPVNETSKCMATLYLRRDDEVALLASLDLYKSNRALMARLGLPHKLGVLLHGPPGTGKSSAIAAIATYLRKDIYYIHLGSVRTNEELRLLFDHITRNCTNQGGVIVMEDVDAMTPVVHRRDGGAAPPPPPAVADADAPLTLDYFLNLLQGTLTMDGTVFLTTTNHLEIIDPAFYREGRFDSVMRLGECDRYQVRAAFAQFFSREPDPALLSRVREGAFTPAAIVARFARFVCVADADDATVLAPFLSSG